MFDLPRSAVQVVAMKELPRKINGKPDYQLLPDVDRAHALAGTK
jgi:hypothetical protein